MFTPLSPQQWNYETAAHFLNRAAGFGGTPAEIEAAYGKGLETLSCCGKWADHCRRP